jgi:tRNA (guanine37-N1)-methyltransferase
MLRKRLQGKVYNSFDIIGDIAIIRAPNASPVDPRAAAKAVMSIHRNVKTVLLQTSPVAGELRLRSLTHMAGENKTRTVHRESGCLFAVDVAETYFSPRLSHERMRIAKLVAPGETAVNMFAGVGCFSITIAKHSGAEKVYSIDLNPAAVQSMEESIRLNRVYDRVTPLLGDAKDIINRKLKHVADRVLMPLPEKAIEYLPAAVSALKPSGGWIHLYIFEHAAKNEDPAEKAKLKVAEALAALGVAFEVQSVRVVRSTGPNWYQLAADIHVIFSQMK